MADRDALINALASVGLRPDDLRNKLAGDPAWPTLPPLPDNRPSLSPYDPQAGRPMDWAERSGVGEGAGLAPMRGAASLGELLGRTRQDIGDRDWGGLADMAPMAAAIFAGPRAKTANLPALARAQELAANGATRDVIRNETGWHQGSDSKWRWEIDDSKSSLNPLIGDVTEWRGADNIKMGDTLKHPDLYAAYPELADIRSSGRIYGPSDYVSGAANNGTVGQYGLDAHGQPVINVASDKPEGIRSAVLHELQHGIPEGFANGASLKTFTQQKEAELARDALSFRRELERLPPGMDRSAKRTPLLTSTRKWARWTGCIPARPAT